MNHVITHFPPPPWQKSKLAGARDILAGQARVQEAELNKSEYRTVEEEFRKLLIQIKVHALCSCCLLLCRSRLITDH